MQARTKFTAEVYVLSEKDGGRNVPFVSGYRPDFFIFMTDLPGTITLLDGVETVMPGELGIMEIELNQPVTIKEGIRFAIRENKRTIAAGVVSAIVD